VSYPAKPEHPFDAGRCPNKDGDSELYERCVLLTGHEGSCLILGLPKPLALPRRSDIKKATLLKAMREKRAEACAAP
jgi:hypothetical protein